MSSRRNRIWGITSTLIVVQLAICLLGCGSNPSYKASDFPDVLNVKNVPQQARDWSSFCMSDQGAWFGFALPDSKTENGVGYFPGPFLMTHGHWLSPGLMQIRLKVDDVILDLDTASEIETVYYPGRLCHSFRLDDVEVDMILIIANNRTALIRSQVTNLSGAHLKVNVGWQGSIFYEKARFAEDGKGVVIRFDDSVIGRFSFAHPGEMHASVGTEANTYQLSSKLAEDLEPAAKAESFIAFSLCFDDEDWNRESSRVYEILQKPNDCFKENRNRWAGYLNDVLQVETRWAADPSYRRIAVKATMTLINNWKCANGDLLHDGLFPSHAVRYFNGFWGWDSWKHAVALARFAPEVAKDQVRTMFDYQDEFGMVADVIYADKSENNWRDTKPPLAAWAVWSIFKSTGEIQYLEEMTHKLLKFHQWWYGYRDHDQNGLCEYGSTDGTIVAARWESGMDDGLRFDETKMVQNSESAWSMNQESMDLNSYFFADKLYLVRILNALGRSDEASQMEKDAMKLRDQIQNEMYDAESRFFHDRKLEDHSFVRVKGPEGWIPLWAGAASNDQAAGVREAMLDTAQFATFIPFPTIPKDHPKFMSGYWRGPVWLDQAYFGVKALRNYGYKEDADRFTQQLFDRPEGLKDATGPIRENYDPRDGKGMKVNHFSWSAAHLLMLFWED